MLKADVLGRVLVLLALLLGFTGIARAQQTEPAEKERPAELSPRRNVAFPVAPKAIVAVPEGAHQFWDRRNAWLFSGVGSARVLDYFSTLNMRRRGRGEILLANDTVDNHAAFAAIEAAGTGVSLGASYLLHHFGHHSLERWMSVVHISVATSGAIRNYCLKTAHPAPQLH